MHVNDREINGVMDPANGTALAAAHGIPACAPRPRPVGPPDVGYFCSAGFGPLDTTTAAGRSKRPFSEYPVRTTFTTCSSFTVGFGSCEIASC